MRNDNPANLPASVRHRLLNLSRKRNEEFQLLLIRYGVERLLYRLSLSPHAKRFVLKGAMLFQLWTGQPHRSTLDVDLLAYGDDDVPGLVKLFTQICSLNVPDDGLTFLPDSVTGRVIREAQRYGGVRLQLTAFLDKARIALQIDIGFGDAITPNPEQIQYPTLLGQPAPILRAYPKETAIAEKYEAMVSLGIANSRMKDFYDLWVLASKSEFNGARLARAVRATFERRKTDLPATTPVALSGEFAQDKSKRTQWTAFVRRGRLISDPPDLEQVVDVLRSFLWPLTEALVAGRDFAMNWTLDQKWQ